MTVDWPGVLSHTVHDVRAMARKGLSNAQLLERGANDAWDESMRNQLAAIIASQRDLDRLMAQLRGLVESTSSDLALLWADVQDLETLVLSARIEQQAYLTEGAAKLTVDPLPSISLPLKMHAVIGELLRNAVRFRSPERPLEIHIRGLQTDSLACLEVQDNGQGWDPSFTDRLFQPFQRLSATGCGFGLGLATARGWVEGAGGEIMAETAPGATRFTVRMPLPSAA